MILKATLDGFLQGGLTKGSEKPPKDHPFQ
jgi:hypothetical protein